MLVDKLNLNQLRVFECVYRNKSMTRAAKELHLTQSGVSQHIAALEEVLDLRFFDRIKQRLVPTRHADLLFKRCFDALQAVETVLTEIKGGERHLSGSVAIGMPIEFGNNVILPLLASFYEKHPLLHAQVRYGFASEMNEAILSGALDFAFVDAFTMDRRIEIVPVYDERLVLCVSPALLKRRFGQLKVKVPAKLSERKKFFESLDYVDYQPGEPVLRKWFEFHLGATRLELNVRSTLMDVQGVARLVQVGLAAGVLPGHLYERLKKEGDGLIALDTPGKDLRNRISMAYLPERSASPGAIEFRESLRQALKKRSEN